MKELLIIGAGGHARVVCNTAVLAGYKIRSVLDLNFSGEKETIFGAKVHGGITQLQPSPDFDIFLAIGDNRKRKKIYLDLKSKGFSFPFLIHPSSIIGMHVEIGEGTLIMAGAIINACSSVGVGVIINTGATVDHECIIGDFSHVTPGVNIAGRVRIGAETFVGIGTAIIQGVSIGKGCVIGANSTVTQDLSDYSKLVGLNRIIE